jgi:hypothetical protein
MKEMPYYDDPPSSIKVEVNQVEIAFTEWLQKHQSEYLTDEVLDQLHQDMHGTTLDDPSDQKPEGIDTKFLLAFFLLAKASSAPVLDSFTAEKDNRIYRMVAFLQNEKFDSVEHKGKALKRIIAKNEPEGIGEERFWPLQQVEDRLLAFKEALKTDDEVYLKIQNTIENLRKYYRLRQINGR